MRLHRFIGNFNLDQNCFKIYDEEIINQAKNVLRLKIGDSLILADGASAEAVVNIIGLDKKFIEVTVSEKSINKKESEKFGVLYCSILKRENFEWVAQKATECGIKEIIPVVSQRTIKLGFKKERLEKIIREAAEQSGRGKLPVLGEALKFEAAIEKARENDLNLFFEMDSLMINKEEVGKAGAGKIGIFIGPEGGWSDEELELMKNEAKQSDKFKMSGLGKTTLRAETAAVVASWFVMQI
jgi:16S rRNA (uracil1498-N3)-methyltransferase